jgi:imidazolonepropionase-like amidohydrolase
MIAEGADGPIAAPDGAMVVDAAGRTLMPGLIDPQWHTMPDSLPIARMMTADMGDVHFAARHSPNTP